MSESADTLGLYLSVPFCRAKCSFCNFASGVAGPGAVEQYVLLLCEEIRGARAWAGSQGLVLPDVVDTVYFGGGTPSLLEAGELQSVLGAVQDQFALGAGAEITLEAAPGQIAEELLGAALEAGVNRVSLGVQSFDDREAQAVGRSHTEASCLAEFARLRAAGVRNLGVDLIAGLPYQTEASWEHSLEVAAVAELEHLSVYMLEVDEESRLGREVLAGGARLHAPAVASDDLMAALYERACERLPEAGFGQYEISNFARPGWASKHNRKYWQRAPYLGFGLDAHSMLYGEDGRTKRWANPEELRDYAGAACVREVTEVGCRAAFEETVFLGLRLSDGLAWSTISSYQWEWVRELREQVGTLSREGMMGLDQERFWLTGRGRMVSGEVFGELLAGAYA